MAYQDELNNYFNELVGVFKGPLSIPDSQKIFSPLDIINASFIITQKYGEKDYTDRNYSFPTSAIEYTDPTSYVFCSGTGDTYRFLSLPFNPYTKSNIDSIERDEEGNLIIEVKNIITGESTKLLCLDENFNIVKDEDDSNSDCVTSITNWNADEKSGKYIISYYYDFTYLIFVQVRDKSQEVTNNG